MAAGDFAFIDAVQKTAEKVHVLDPQMPMRDRFALQVLAVLLASGRAEGHRWEDIAADAYSAADAMLKARRA